LIERLDVQFCTLESRPGIFQMIGRIGAANDIGGQAPFGLEPRKRLERRGGEHAAKIPNHRFNHRLLRPCERGLVNG
jgi:hypothetical protein